MKQFQLTRNKFGFCSLQLLTLLWAFLWDSNSYSLEHKISIILHRQNHGNWGLSAYRCVCVCARCARLRNEQWDSIQVEKNKCSHENSIWVAFQKVSLVVYKCLRYYVKHKHHIHNNRKLIVLYCAQSINKTTRTEKGERESTSHGEGERERDTKTYQNQTI